jgi:hypothetical protein
MMNDGGANTTNIDTAARQFAAQRFRERQDRGPGGAAGSGRRHGHMARM